jgi:peptidyl-prolyl cis-trans isomerase D
MDRGGALADFAPDAALSEALFAARPGVWLPTAYAVEGKSEGPGALLCRVDAVQPPDPQEWNTVRDLMSNGVSRERVDGLYQLFMQNLASRARVEILNPDVVDRVNM